MTMPSLPENIRFKTTLRDLQNWIRSLDDDEAKIVAAPVQSLADLPRGYPDAASVREQIADWLEVKESNSWDPPWNQIVSRISTLIILLERGFARPFSSEPAATESEAAARNEARLAKLRQGWAALRSGSLSQQWLANGFVPDSIPLEGEGTAYPPILTNSASASPASEPGKKVADWLDGLDEENYQLLGTTIRLVLPEGQLPREGLKQYFANYFSGGDRPSTATGDGYLYDRILVLAFLIDGGLGVRFSGAMFDQNEETARKLKSGELKPQDLFPPGLPVPEDQMKNMADFLIAELETLPAKRAAASKAGDAWKHLLAEDLADNRLRMWCAKAA